MLAESGADRRAHGHTGSEPKRANCGGGVNDVPRYAKRRVAARRLAQSTCRLVAILHYRIGLAGANAGLPFLPVALDGAGYGAALLWGGLQ